MKHYYKNSLCYLLWLALVIFPLTTRAHAPDQSYIFLRVYGERIGGRFEIMPKDLNRALGLDLPEKGTTVRDLEPHLPRIQAYLREHVSFASAEATYDIRFGEPGVLKLDMGEFAQFNFSLDGAAPVPEALEVRYEVLFEQDTRHQCILVVEYNWKAGVYNNETLISLIFSPDNERQQLTLADASVWTGFLAMVWMGVWHIWIGIDHILFLLALILPAVMRRRRNEQGGIPAAALGFAALPGPLTLATDDWTPVERFRPALIQVVKIVTFFTIAHTITLSLAALNIINLPSRFVESVIALSIGLAAYHNIRPLFRKNDWLIAFGFGLFHGFGFASVLGEIGLSGEFLTLSLLGFNVGVEVGQIVIIALIFPLLYFLRQSPAYPKILLYGSLVLIFIALYWFVERSFEVDYPLDEYVGRGIRKVVRVLRGG